MSDFATLTFKQDVSAPLGTLWETWTAPGARAVWAGSARSTSVEIVEADTRVGGREVSRGKVDGGPDILCEWRWLDLQAPRRSIASDVTRREGLVETAALVTADLSGTTERSHLGVTVQLSASGAEREEIYRAGFAARLDDLAAVAERTMVLQRVIDAPRSVVSRGWMNETLPKWWGPDGFSCRTQRIDLRSGGEWVFDMIASDGTVYPNHHLYHEVRTDERVRYALLWGEGGPKHADAWIALEDHGEATRLTLGMIFSTAAEYQSAKGFGAEELGLQTLGKLARFVTAG